MDEQAIREQFCQAINQLWTRGWIIGADGMLCSELHRRRYLVAPVGKRRIDLKPDDLTCVDIGGEDVHGGENLPTDLWQPHRDVYQTHINEDGTSLKASAEIESVKIATLLKMQAGCDRLELCGESIPVINGQDNNAMRDVLGKSTEAVLMGRGLFLAADDLPSLLNRIERIDYLAALKLAER